MVLGGGLCNTIDVFDLTTLTFSRTLNNTEYKTFHYGYTAGHPSSTLVVVPGGYGGASSDSSVGNSLNSVQVYQAGTSTLLYTLNTTAAALVPGVVTTQVNGVVLTIIADISWVDIFNHSTGTINNSVFTFNPPRSDIRIVAVGTYVVLIGGCSTSPGQASINYIEVYDLSTLTHVVSLNTLVPRCRHSVGQLGPHIYIAGGGTISGEYDTGLTASVEVIDTRTWQQFYAEDLSVPMEDGASASSPYAVFFAGGVTNASNGKSSAIDLYRCGNGVCSLFKFALFAADFGCGRDVR